MAVKNGKENTRERIISSAKKLFAEQGYQKATIPTPTS
jgi:AcrR family transcriptional regulator